MVSQCVKTVNSDSQSADGISEWILQEDLESLFQHLHVKGIWIETDGPIQETSQHFLYTKDNVYLSSEAIEDCVTLARSLATQSRPLKVYPLLASSCAQYSYLCTYHGEISHLEQLKATPALSGYWIVWADVPLTKLHQYCIEQQVKALQTRQQHLLARAQLNRQVNALRQTLYKTEHQLKTPLSLVELHADILQQSLPSKALKAQAQQICKTVSDIAVSLNRLTRWDESAREETMCCDLRDVLTECIQELTPYLKEKGISIVRDHRPLPISVDAWQMKQVLHNILNNAIAFTPINSTITCRWQSVDKEILVEISDQGPGFSSEDIANLFTPFYSRRQAGTGLGLIIARDTLRAHKGELKVANSASGGATISIVLPRT